MKQRPRKKPADTVSNQPHIPISEIVLPFEDEESSSPLHFTNAKLPFLGREKEKEQLQEFCDSTVEFRWLQIAGEAGQGKSRLGFYIKNAKIEDGWDAGFYRHQILRNSFRKLMDGNLISQH